LETAYDGKIYFATSKYNTDLHCITNPNAAAGATIITTTPSYSFGPGNAISYCLPEQIDGENGNVTPVASGIITASATSVCIGQPVTLSVTGGTSYEWNGVAQDSTATIIESPSSDTAYFVSVIYGGCSLTDTIEINVNDSPLAAATYSLNACGNLQFENNSVGAATFHWNFGDGTTSVVPAPGYYYPATGSYPVTLIATSVAGCADTTLITVDYNTGPPAIANVSVSITNGDITTASIQNYSQNGVNCILYLGNGDSLTGCGWINYEYAYSAPGDYLITQVVTNSFGCVDSDQVTVHVEFESTLYVPNAFTPNGSGPNELFMAYGTEITEFQLDIFDRWGEQIFESQNLNEGWDGKFRGRMVEQGVYIWKIAYSDSKHANHSLVGHLTVVR
jgi:gliding motility-associated-like protein